MDSLAKSFPPGDRHDGSHTFYQLLKFISSVLFPETLDMLRTCGLVRLVGWGCLLLCCGPAWADAVPVAPQVGEAETSANAALVYWQAFAMFPQLSEKQEEMVGDFATVDLQADQAEIADILSAARTTFLLADKLPPAAECDWGIVNMGPSTLLPHLSKARQLARLMLLRARYQAAYEEPDQAVDDLLFTARLARHVNQGVLIDLLVGIALEKQVIAVSEGLQAKLMPAQVAALKHGLENLPARGTLAESLEGERDIFGMWLVELVQDPDRAAALKKMAEITGEQDSTFQFIKQMPQPALLMMANDLIAGYEEMIAAAKLPPDEASARLKEIEEQTKKASAFRKMLLPAVGRAFESYHNHAKAWDEFLAGLAPKQN